MRIPAMRDTEEDGKDTNGNSGPCPFENALKGVAATHQLFRHRARREDEEFYGQECEGPAIHPDGQRQSTTDRDGGDPDREAPKPDQESGKRIEHSPMTPQPKRL